MPRKINDGLTWETREKRKRAQIRKEPHYTVFLDGMRISSFAFPREKAERVFMDLLASNPKVTLDLVDKPKVGDAVRDLDVHRHRNQQPIRTKL